MATEGEKVRSIVQCYMADMLFLDILNQFQLKLNSGLRMHSKGMTRLKLQTTKLLKPIRVKNQYIFIFVTSMF